MRMQPLVTVKKAAAKLGVDKETIRTKLASGEIKGERRRVGSKDKWFVYPGELEQLVEQKEFLELDEKERLATDDMVELFDELDSSFSPDCSSASAGNDLKFHPQPSGSAAADEISETHVEGQDNLVADRQHLVLANQIGTGLEAAAVLDQLIQTLTREFSQALGEEKRKTQELEIEIEEQNEILKVASESELSANLRANALSEEVSNLKSTIADLKDQLSRKTSWWKRIFS